MTSAFRAVALRDLRKFWRSPFLVAAALLLPLAQLLVVGHTIGGRIRDVSVGVADADGGPAALALRARLHALEATTRAVRLVPVGSVEEAVELLRLGELSGAVAIPAGFSSAAMGAGEAELGFLADNTDLFVAAHLASSLRSLRIGEPSSAGSAGDWALGVVELFAFTDYIQYLTPGAIAAGVYITCLIGGGVLYVDDRLRGLHEGYLATPATAGDFVGGLIAAGTLKAVVCGAFTAALGVAYAGLLPRVTVSTAMTLVVVLTAAAFALTSLTTALVARIRDPFLPRVLVAVMNLGLLLPSGAIWPVESFPGWMRPISAADPLTYVVRALRAALLRESGWEAVGADVAVLAALGTAGASPLGLFFPVEWVSLTPLRPDYTLDIHGAPNVPSLLRLLTGLTIFAGIALPQPCNPLRFVTTPSAMFAGRLPAGQLGAGLERMQDGSHTRREYVRNGTGLEPATIQVGPATANFDRQMYACSGFAAPDLRPAAGFRPFATNQLGIAASNPVFADIAGDGRLTGMGIERRIARDALIVGTTTADIKPDKAAIAVPVGPEPTSVLTADLNGDGRLDAVVTYSGGFADGPLGGVSALLNDGAGGFRAAINTVVARGVITATAGDWNRDGRIDVAVSTASGDGAVYLLRGRGDGRFEAPVMLARLFSTRLLAADLTGDGREDLIAIGAVTSGFAYLPGAADGFGAPVEVDAGLYGPFSGAAGDYNGDGRIDVVLASFASGSIAVALNQGGGRFTLGPGCTAGPQPQTLFAMDFDGDGKLDIVLGSGHPDRLAPNPEHGQIAVLRGRGDGSFIGAGMLLTDRGPTGVAVGTSTTTATWTSSCRRRSAATRSPSAAGTAFSRSRAVPRSPTEGRPRSSSGTSTATGDRTSRSAIPRVVCGSRWAAPTGRLRRRLPTRPSRAWRIWPSRTSTATGETTWRRWARRRPLGRRAGSPSSPATRTARWERRGTSRCRPAFGPETWPSPTSTATGGRI